MTKQWLSGAPTERSLLRFFHLVFALSIPLSLAGTAVGLELLPGLPVGSLVVTWLGDAEAWETEYAALTPGEREIVDALAYGIRLFAARGRILRETAVPAGQMGA